MLVMWKIAAIIGLISVNFQLGKSETYKIALIADQDDFAKVIDANNQAEWVSSLWHGEVAAEGDPNDPNFKVTVKLEKNVTLKYKLNYGGRGMELSDLVFFNKKLYTCDDKTGEIYELITNESQVLHFQLLNSGDGTVNRPFKCEWLAVKNGTLYAGSTGKPFFNGRKESNHDSQFIKKISTDGIIESEDWKKNYDKMRMQAGYEGYMIHESAVWSETCKKWYFLPRKASNETFDEKKDETSNVNILLSTDENFENIEKKIIGDLDREYGFSAFRFIPGLEGKAFVALKSKEVGKTLATRIVAYTVGGVSLMTPIDLQSVKYEGIEFWPN